MKWHSAGKGLEYREHKTRKHGVRFDRYYRGRYKIDGRTMAVTFGWESEHPKKGRESFRDVCMKELLELKSNARKGKGPTTLKEKRELANAENEKNKLQEEKARKDQLTFSEIFNNQYLPYIKGNRKNPKSVDYERSYFKNWLEPAIGKLPLKDISPIDIERIKQRVLKKRAVRTAVYGLQIIRQVFNYSVKNGFFTGPNPIKGVKFPKVDNRRMRFLTREEAISLLQAIKKRSIQTYEISLLALKAGLRANEIFRLKWSDVNMKEGILTLRDTKSGKTRFAFLENEVKEMLKERKQSKPCNQQEYVFQSKKGGKITKISHAFWRAVNDLNLNENIVDSRYKVTFHTLRHTFASWLVEKGTGLYEVKELLGHQSFAMTSRYSHLSNNALKSAVQKLEKVAQDEKPEVISMKGNEK